MLERRTRNEERRTAVFRAVYEVLENEERDWARALEADDAMRDRFEWACGVRCASELAIGYLAIKTLVCHQRLSSDFVWPERQCGGGRMDLWVGEHNKSDGLGVELKFLMGPNSAVKVRVQAERLRKHPNVNSAAFILWGHGISPTSQTHPNQLFHGLEQDGWTSWEHHSGGRMPAHFRGNNTLDVWLFGSERR